MGDQRPLRRFVLRATWRGDSHSCDLVVGKSRRADKLTRSDYLFDEERRAQRSPFLANVHRVQQEQTETGWSDLERRNDRMAQHTEVYL